MRTDYCRIQMTLTGRHIVKIGDSIKNNQKSNLVSFQYDFIPGTVINDAPGEVTFERDSGISVNLRTQSGNYTQFKGAMKDAMKECVLIVDKKVSLSIAIL